MFLSYTLSFNEVFKGLLKNSFCYAQGEEFNDGIVLYLKQVAPKRSICLLAKFDEFNKLHDLSLAEQTRSNVYRQKYRIIADAKDAYRNF